MKAKKPAKRAQALAQRRQPGLIAFARRRPEPSINCFIKAPARPAAPSPGLSKDLMPRISVGRKDGTGELVRPQAVASFYFPNYVPVEVFEVPLHESAIQMARLVQLICNYGCCRERSDQTA